VLSPVLIFVLDHIGRFLSTDSTQSICIRAVSFYRPAYFVTAFNCSRHSQPHTVPEVSLICSQEPPLLYPVLVTWVQPTLSFS
jgi:hypothetical protein